MVGQKGNEREGEEQVRGGGGTAVFVSSLENTNNKEVQQGIGWQHSQFSRLKSCQLFGVNKENIGSQR